MASPEPEAPRRRGFSILGPALLIGLGIIFLLNSLDILPWEIWASLWRFWPVILILIGLEIMLRRTPQRRDGWSFLGRMAIPVILVAVLVGLAVAASQAGWIGGVLPSEEQPRAGSVERELGRLQEAKATVEFGAGRLELNSLPAASDRLVVVDYRVGAVGLAPGLRLEERAGRGVLHITGRERFRFGRRAEPDEWDLHLNKGVPLELTVRLGAADGDLDMTDLKVRTLNLDVGASSVLVRFPKEAGLTRATVKAGAASLILEIPPGVGARIVSESGLASIDVSSRFSRSNGVYANPEYQTAANRLDLELKAGVSSVSVR